MTWSRMLTVTNDSRLVSEHNFFWLDVSLGHHVPADGVALADGVENIPVVSRSRLIVLIPGNINFIVAIPIARDKYIG